jgi:hypothetical protein
MTWKEFKEEVESKGIKDEDGIYRIRIMYPTKDELIIARPYEGEIEILN